MVRYFHICHFTSVHPRFDNRIFHKMCLSLSSAGHRVTLVVADGKGDEIYRGIHIKDAGRCGSGRLGRIVKTSWQVYKIARDESADIYHFHDPELIIAGLLLQKHQPVIYDAHEDVPRQTLEKHYLPKILRTSIARCIEWVENYSARKFSAICAATPHIRDRFKNYNKLCIDVNNFPKLGELFKSNIPWRHRPKKICYIGVIAKVRGILELIQAMPCINGELSLAGNYSPNRLRKELIKYTGWEKVNELGFVNRGGVRKILDESRVGLVTLHPTLSYIDSLPVKMFEYMASGIPVIASNFPLWRDIVERYNCGICVDPQNIQEITDATNLLLRDDLLAESMGENGTKAVGLIFNWKNEEIKLFNLYHLLSDGLCGSGI